MEELIRKIKLILGNTSLTSNGGVSPEIQIKEAIQKEWAYFLSDYVVSNPNLILQLSRDKYLVPPRRAVISKTSDKPFNITSDVPVSYYKLPEDLVSLLTITSDKSLLDYSTFSGDQYNFGWGIGGYFLPTWSPFAYNRILSAGQTSSISNWKPVVQYGRTYIASMYNYNSLAIEYLSNNPDYILNSDPYLVNAYTYYIAVKFIPQFSKDNQMAANDIKEAARIILINLKNNLA